MTQSGVERTKRTASRPVSTLIPSRPTLTPAGTGTPAPGTLTGSGAPAGTGILAGLGAFTAFGGTTGRSIRRVALRAAVLTGFAGAAWLLSASAAQAAEAHGEPVTTVLANTATDALPATSTAALPAGSRDAIPAGSTAGSTVEAVLPADSTAPPSVLNRLGEALLGTGTVPAAHSSPASPAKLVKPGRQPMPHRKPAGHPHRVGHSRPVHGGADPVTATVTSVTTATTVAGPVTRLTSTALTPLVAGTDAATTLALPAAASGAGSLALHPDLTAIDLPAGWPARPDGRARTDTAADAAADAGSGAADGAGSTVIDDLLAASRTHFLGGGGRAPAVDLIGALQILTAPLGLAGPFGPAGPLADPAALLAPLTSVIDPVLQPLSHALRPLTDAFQSAAAPVMSVLGLASQSTTSLGARPAGGSRTRTTAVTTGTRHSTRRYRPEAPQVAPAGDGPAQPGPVAVPGLPGGVPAAVGTSSTSSGRRAAGAQTGPGRALAPAGTSGTQDLPGSPLPAPVRGYLGGGSGIPTTGSGLHTDGGAVAVVPSSVADSMVASHRLPVAADVEVLWLVAGDPTVSPD